MRQLIRDVVLAFVLSSIFVFAFVFAVVSASRAQSIGGPLDECKAPSKVFEEVANAVGADRFIGARVFSADEVKTIAADVVEKTAQPFEYDTLAVIFVKADPHEGGDDTAIGLMGKGGQVCEFVIMPAKMFREYIDKVLGPKA